jgi:cytochrome c oxidase subunit 2
MNGRFYTRLSASILGLPLLALLFGCSASKQFEPIPREIDTEKVPHQIIEMTAEHFHYTPEEIHAKQGTLLIIKIKSIDGTHGFKLGDFGIDLKLEEGVVNTVEVYLPTNGEYGFRCSHFCGIGHLGMKGKLIVE